MSGVVTSKFFHLFISKINIKYIRYFKNYSNYCQVNLGFLKYCLALVKSKAGRDDGGLGRGVRIVSMPIWNILHRVYVWIEWRKMERKQEEGK